MSSTEFYLTTEEESRIPDMPRICRLVAQLKDPISDDHMLIEITPPFIGQKFGLGAEDLSVVIVSPRFVGETLFPISEWPCHVFVSRVLDDAVKMTRFIEPGQVEVFAWGKLLKTNREKYN